MKEFIFGKNYNNQLIIKLKNGKEINLILSKNETEKVKNDLMQILIELNLTEYLLKNIEED